MPARLPVAVLLSGGGRTLQNLLDRSAAGSLPVEVRVAISDREGAFGIERARRAGVSALVLAPRAYSTREAWAAAIGDAIDAHGASLVLMGGFTVLWPFPARFRGRVLNIHPALIPSFCGRGMYGLRVHEAAIARGVKLSGCTVHFVDDEYDHGPIVVQRAVPVEEGDTAETLAERVFAAECEAYPEAIALYAAARLRIEGARCRVLPPPRGGA